MPDVVFQGYQYCRIDRILIRLTGQLNTILTPHLTHEVGLTISAKRIGNCDNLFLPLLSVFETETEVNEHLIET
jgi:hypothetical protein